MQPGASQNASTRAAPSLFMPETTLQCGGVSSLHAMSKPSPMRGRSVPGRCGSSWRNWASTQPLHRAVSPRELEQSQEEPSVSACVDLSTSTSLACAGATPARAVPEARAVVEALAAAARPHGAALTGAQRACRLTHYLADTLCPAGGRPYFFEP